MDKPWTRDGHGMDMGWTWQSSGVSKQGKWDHGVATCLLCSIVRYPVIIHICGRGGCVSPSHHLPSTRTCHTFHFPFRIAIENDWHAVRCCAVLCGAVRCRAVPCCCCLANARYRHQRSKSIAAVQQPAWRSQHLVTAQRSVGCGTTPYSPATRHDSMSVSCDQYLVQPVDGRRQGISTPRAGNH
ncbi:hypothetical protein P154DRAFT_48143 [Amniculicola lignicola CBS 123094]|uniref:Uncharacterized protein n=1 Tax=Amniculicola lignicola CBS 123094 TaxID=1392246 RepID=A0A6A5VWI0_9PLEO|nr:hypothetical protein P154DRAFT_48143 [Amniculicola lignicola CBS 123094]